VNERILVTGGCGFIGSNFVRLVLDEHPEADVEDAPRYRFVRGDIADEQLIEELFAEGGFDMVFNFAAETHVDRSILSGLPFVRTNVMGTAVLLEAARKHGCGRFVHVSTDEVYGALGATGKFTESSPLAPNNPYSATKAGADMLVRSHVRTHGTDAVITRCCNNYGPYQFPEKLIPLFTANALEEAPLPVYGDGMQVREWIHAADHARALIAVAERGEAGEVYNVGSGAEVPNIEVVRAILRALDKPESLIRHVEDRPGHDRRYALDTTKLHDEIGWSPTVPFDEGVAGTVKWYVENRPWWERIRSGEYRKYYSEQYGRRLAGTGNTDPGGETP